MLTVEVSNDGSAGWYCPMLKCVLRGRLDFAKFKEPLAGVELINFPNGVPGQLIDLDVAGRKAAVRDPLHAPEHADLVKKIARRLTKGQRDGKLELPKEREEFALTDGDYETHSAATWAYWLRRGVEGGLLKVVRGELPDAKKIAGKPRTRFFSHQTEDPAERERREKREERALRVALLTPEQRKVYERELARADEAAG